MQQTKVLRTTTEILLLWKRKETSRTSPEAAVVIITSPLLFPYLLACTNSRLCEHDTSHTHTHAHSDRWWSRDEHLQSALVVGEMERTVSDPQVTIVRLVGIDVGFVQLVGLVHAANHTHTHTHTYWYYRQHVDEWNKRGPQYE